ncbi:MAG: hypothetical protein NC191_01770 [Muribaculaceae bacterium]|nr:hypothetical protein [Muribaculaceae bacterium]
MIEKINSHIQQYNYNTISKVRNSAESSSVQKTSTQPAFTAKTQVYANPSNQVQLRTTLNGKEEKEKYTKILSSLSKSDRKTAEYLLKSGILLNADSNDKSTVLDNLYKIITEKRAEGLDGKTMLKDTISTLAYPYLITQQFGDIPAGYQEKAINANIKDKTNLIEIQQGIRDINVEHSGTCVAASTEFKLAKQMPAEFARFAQELSSPKMSVEKTIGLKNLADNTLNAIWLLNAFEVPYEADNFDNAKLKFAPDENAIIRAQIQTTDKDPYERTPLDVLMQSTFMQVGSQQSYNTLTDKREGKFNQSDKGLIEFEKTFTESVVFDKNILSITYQTVDENARLIGYETDLGTMKRHLIQALNEGENVIIGYTQTDSNNIILNGHEITIVDYKQSPNGGVTFICNDTDDNISRPIEYPEEYLLPKIHHAALPQHIVEEDLNVVPNWVEGIEVYKQIKNAA